MSNAVKPLYDIVKTVQDDIKQYVLDQTLFESFVPLIVLNES